MTEAEFLRWALWRITKWDHEQITNIADHKARSTADLSKSGACVGCFAEVVAHAGEHAAQLIIERCK